MLPALSMICARIGRIRAGHQHPLSNGWTLPPASTDMPATGRCTRGPECSLPHDRHPHLVKQHVPSRAKARFSRGLPAVDAVDFLLRPIKSPLDSTERLRELPGSFRNEGSTMKKSNRSITEHLIFAARGAVLVAGAIGNEVLVLVFGMSALALEYRHASSGASDRCNGDHDEDR